MTGTDVGCVEGKRLQHRNASDSSNRTGCRRLGVLLATAIVTMPLRPAAAQTVRDSTGIAVIENEGPFWNSGAAWRVSSTPLVDIGDRGAGAGDEFTRICGLVRLTTGDIVVANAGSHEVRIYSPQGELTFAFGRRGNGPGEFQSMMNLFRNAGDSLIVVHSPGPPLVVALLFSPRGRFVRATPAPHDGQSPTPAPLGVFSDGSFIAWRFDRVPAAGSGAHVDSVSLVRVAAAWTTAIPFARLPYRITESVAGAWLRTGIGFGPRAHLAVLDEDVVWGFSDRFELRYYSPTGTLRRIVRRSGASRPLPAHAPDEYRAWYERTNHIPEVIQGQARRQLQAMRAARLAGITFARHQPVFSAMLADADDHVWVRRYELIHDLPDPGASCLPTFPSPTVWDVFDPTGRWLGPVTLPGRFTPVVIERDAITGVFRDDDDVEHVRVYALDRRRGPS